MQQTRQMQQDAFFHMSSQVNKPMSPEQEDLDPCITSSECSSKV